MYFAGKGMNKLLQKAAKGNERISQKNIQACNASHFQKLWFCPFPGIWHRFRATLRMCPTVSF
jgi:hypothetical protein